MKRYQAMTKTHTHTTHTHTHITKTKNTKMRAKSLRKLEGQSSPYYQNMWKSYCCLTSFFRLSILALIAKI